MGERGSASNTSAAPAPSLAPHYERIALDRHLEAGRALAASMGLRHGERVLELGCGTGLLAAHLADRVGAEGEVPGLDALPLRVQIAHQRGRHNLRFQVGDAYQLARFGAGIRHDAMHLMAIACKPLPQPAQAPRFGPSP